MQAAGRLTDGRIILMHDQCGGTTTPPTPATTTPPTPPAGGGCTTVSWDFTGPAMTARPNGGGDVFGFTVQHGGNGNWPPASCRAA